MEPLLETVHQASSKYYIPGTELSIDEAIIYLCGYSQDTFKMSNKPIDESYKVFCLADHRYIFDFHMTSHSRSTPGVERVDNLSNTSAMVFSLAMSLPYK